MAGKLLNLGIGRVYYGGAVHMTKKKSKKRSKKRLPGRVKSGKNKGQFKKR